MIIDGNHIIAEEGYFLRRKSDKEIVGTEYYLGYIYYLNGELLPEPHLEVASDFTEISEDGIRQEKEALLYPPLVEQYIREQYSISDELAIQRQRDTKPEKFKEYFEYCESCKARAREELGI